MVFRHSFINRAHEKYEIVADAVNTLKNAILQSQARAERAVNQEQLSLYYGIGRYIAINTRNKKLGYGYDKVYQPASAQRVAGASWL